MPTLSITIPVFDEEKFIEACLKKVIAADTCGFSKEIIIIDDCSKDKTLSQVQKLVSIEKTKKNAPIFKIIAKETQEGKGAALKRGFLESTGDIVIVQDADLEYDPSEFEIMLKPFTSYDADVVYGSRFVTNKPHRVLYFWHYVANVCLTIFSNIFTNLNLTDMETGYKAFRGDIIRKIAPHLVSKRFGFEPEITAKISKIRDVKIYEVGISYFGRTYEEGKKIGWKDGVRALWEIVKYNIFTP